MSFEFKTEPSPALHTVIIIRCLLGQKTLTTTTVVVASLSSSITAGRIFWPRKRPSRQTTKESREDLQLSGSLSLAGRRIRRKLYSCLASDRRKNATPPPLTIAPLLLMMLMMNSRDYSTNYTICKFAVSARRKRRTTWLKLNPRHTMNSSSNNNRPWSHHHQHTRQRELASISRGSNPHSRPLFFWSVVVVVSGNNKGACISSYHYY